MTVADEELLIVTLNSRFEPLITPSNVPSIDPVATGSMLGTFEGVINGSNLEFRVTMSSSSSATVITKIDSISA